MNAHYTRFARTAVVLLVLCTAIGCGSNPSGSDAGPNRTDSRGTVSDAVLFETAVAPDGSSLSDAALPTDTAGEAPVVTDTGSPGNDAQNGPDASADSGCVRQCLGRVCGPDGCGGDCGACPANSTCVPDRTFCGCDTGYFPSSDLNSCVRVGQPCGVASLPEYCVNNQFWAFCDPIWGLQTMDCGAGQCLPNANGTGRGSCTCGAPGTTFPSLANLGAGACIRGSWSNVDNEEWWMCGANRTYRSNCRAATGLSTGRCWALVSSFGSQTGCFCDTCSQYNFNSNTCSPACISGLTCSVISTVYNTFTCN